MGDKLLVLTAMNLCAKQLELGREHAAALLRYQAQVEATVAAVARTLERG